VTYALRYRWWVVLLGVALASRPVHGVSVAVGHFLGPTMTTRLMAFTSATAILIFAILADGLAIAIGTWLHQRLPTQLLHVLASLPFLVFGLWILFDSALGRHSVAMTVATAAALMAAIAVVTYRSQTSRRRRMPAPSAEKSPDTA